MKIESNTVNKLKKIMNGETFSDVFTFITELLQNSQRAKAKNVSITLKEDILVFSDDGCGCKTPNSVFTLDSSDWKTTDEGFGIGFMSVFAIPELELLEVHSNNWEATVDVNAVREGDLNIKTDAIYPITGFKVILKSNWFKERFFEIEDKIKEETKYISDFKTVFNNSEIETISLLDSYKPNSFAIKHNCSDFEGIFEISRWGCIKVYYENRFVCETYSFTNGVSGIMLLKKARNLLREPDRKDFVRGNAYYKLVKKMSKIGNTLYKMYIDHYGMDNENVIQGIMKNLSEKEIEERLDFSDLLKDNTLENTESTEKTENTEINYLTCINEDIDKSIFSEENQINTNQYAISASSVESTNNVTPNNTAAAPGTQKNTNKVKNDKDELKKLSKNLKVAFWVRANEVEKYQDIIAEVKYYNIPVIIAKNQLYDNAFEKRCPHISKMNEHLHVEFIKKDICIKNSKEETFLRMLQPICKVFELSENVFKIANLAMKVTFEKNNKIIYRKVTKNTPEKIQLYGVTNGDSIYLDRKMLNLKHYSIKRGRFNIHEYKCLMNAIETIAHEMAHYIYHTKDNTSAHYQMEISLLQRLMKLY